MSARKYDYDRAVQASEEIKKAMDHAASAMFACGEIASDSCVVRDRRSGDAEEELLCARAALKRALEEVRDVKGMGT